MYTFFGLVTGQVYKRRCARYGRDGREPCQTQIWSFPDFIAERILEVRRDSDTSLPMSPF